MTGVRQNAFCGRLFLLGSAVLVPVRVYGECVNAGADCSQAKCCVDPEMKCYTKDKKYAGCAKSCLVGRHWDPPTDLNPWECEELKAPPTPAPPIVHDPIKGQHWHEGLQSSHFWDCNGAGCDSATLQPWDPNLYVMAPQYAPADPADYGGAKYGEKLWLTGAASDLLSPHLGPDLDCCGKDSKGGGGCGQCLLIQNPTATNQDWLAIVMKKSRCPPWSKGCKTHTHFDLAVPGYDDIAYSTANVCGNNTLAKTYLTKNESGVCAGWYHIKGVKDTIEGCHCSGLPDGTPEQKMLKKGCDLFTAWGWTTGTPMLKFQPVPCPEAFVSRVSGAFGIDGVHAVKLPGKKDAEKTEDSVPALPIITDGGDDTEETVIAPRPDSSPPAPIWKKLMILLLLLCGPALACAVLALSVKYCTKLVHGSQSYNDLK